MQPNLFRSISNAIAERFPILPRVRRSFYGLLLFSILFFVIQCSKDTIHVFVTPVKGNADRTITMYGANTIRLTGELIIANPTVLQRALLTDTTTDLDIISLIIMGVISIIIIRLVPKIYQQNLFRKDISDSIRGIGYIMILHVILRYLSDFIYAPDQVERLTHNEFTTHRILPLWLFAEAYTAMIVLAIGSAYKHGIQLQSEQDLTV